MSILAQNLFYTALIIVSGAVIIKTLKRFKMRTALMLFCVLFGLTLIYVPFYFGGQVMLKLMINFFNDETIAHTFVKNMSGILAAPFVFFKSASVGTAVFAVIVFSASFILTALLTVKVVKWIYDISRATTFVRRPRKIRALFALDYIIDNQNTYKQLAHFRN